MVRYAPRRFYSSIDGWTRASVDDHHLVLAALRSGDADGARQAMRAHIRHAGTLLVVHLEAQGFWETGAGDSASPLAVSYKNFREG